MNTIDEYDGFFSNVEKTIDIKGDVKVHLLSSVIPGTHTSSIGAIGYTKNGSPYRTKHFLVSCGGMLQSTTLLTEKQMLKTMAVNYLKANKDNSVALIDIRLPKANGFSGKVVQAKSILL